MFKKISMALGGALLAQQAFAHHITANFDLGSMANEADLVFHGKVIEIDYRGSQANKGNAPVPHTFVTYEVQDVLFGNPGDTRRRTFTLRFMGGRGDKDNIMLVQQQPQFNIGDEDVLFVTKNGSSECPLVDCVNGRFRVVDQMVYNEYGQKLMRDDKGQIVLGSTELRKEFTTFTIGDQQFSRRSHPKDSQDVGEGVVPQEPGTPDSGEHLDVGTFSAASLERIRAASPNDPQGKARSAGNADKNRSFTLPAPKPVTVAKTVPATPEGNPITDEEKALLEEFRKNVGEGVAR